MQIILLAFNIIYTSSNHFLDHLYVKVMGEAGYLHINLKIFIFYTPVICPFLIISVIAF